MTTISLRLSDADNNLIKKYAELNGMSVSDLVRQSVLDRIEDEYDLKAYHEAMEEYRKNPVTYSHADVIRMLEEENHLTVEMTGDTLGVLIGRRGETMDALQYLTSLTVNKDKNDYTRVSLDVEHYRAKREATLRNLALRMANRARKSGRRVVLEPMNPYERRVLHSALQNNPYVQTHSEGEEPYRRVIITLK